MSLVDISSPYLHCVQISSFGRLQESVVHVRVTCGNIFWKKRKKQVGHRAKRTLSTRRRSGGVDFTVQNLLDRLVAHLSGGESLQRHDGRVGAVAQQQLAGLDVSGQRGSVKSGLPERVDGVYLQSEQAELTHELRDHRTERGNKHSNRPWLRVSAAPPGCHCALAQQQRATES